MSKGEKKQEKDSSKAEYIDTGDFRANQKNAGQPNEKVFKADGQDDEWGVFSWEKTVTNP